MRGRAGGRRWARGAALAVTALLTVGGGAARGAGVTIFPDPTASAGLAHIVPGPDGALYFTQDNAFEIGRITTAGQISQFPVPESQTTAEVGNAGQGPDEIASSGGRLWFLSDTQSRLFAMTTAGQLTEAADGYTTPDGPYVSDPMDGLAASDAGGVWTQARLQDTLRRWSADGSSEQDFALPDNNHSLHPMTLGPDGRVDFGFQNTDGQYIDIASDSGTGFQSVPIELVDHTYEISSLAFSSTGTLWLTEYEPSPGYFPASGGAIGSYTPGAASATATSTQQLGADLVPHSLVAGPGGVMYFATTSGLGKISPGGQITLASVAPYHPTDLAMGSDGNLWFVDASANVIGQASPDTVFSAASTPAPTTQAPKLTLTLAHQSLAAVTAAHGGLKARCVLAGAGTCAATATIPGAAARRLGLTPKAGAGTYALGRAHRTLTRKGTAALTITLSSRVRRALSGARRVTVTVTATSSASGARARHASRRITLSR
jgi:virginiamycin B lyase